MRLTDEQKIIKTHTSKIFGPKAHVLLFGSRVHDSEKGGDIDLLIISDQIDFSEKLKLKICI